jgi:hypothetical protein
LRKLPLEFRNIDDLVDFASEFQNDLRNRLFLRFQVSEVMDHNIAAVKIDPTAIFLEVVDTDDDVILSRRFRRDGEFAGGIRVSPGDEPLLVEQQNFMVTVKGFARCNDAASDRYRGWKIGALGVSRAGQRREKEKET